MTRPNLRDQLITSGHMTHRGTTRHVRASTCPTCHAPTLIGLNDDIAAHEIETDPTPITEIGEVLALTQKRETVNLWGTGKNRRFEIRDRWNIHNRQRPVYAEHRCGQPLPAAPEPPTPRAARPASDAPPPF